MRKATSYSIFLFVIAVSATIKTTAKNEYKNSINVTTAGHYLPLLYQEILYFTPMSDQFGVYYDRKTDNFILSVGFTRWNDRSSNQTISLKPMKIKASRNIWENGAFRYREQYKIIDLIVKYRLTISPKSEIKTGMGISYTWGINTYFDSTVIANYYEQWDRTHKKTEGYLGIVPTISYDYALFKNRISVGADLRYRKYLNLYSSQIDYGIHVGCNF